MIRQGFGEVESHDKEHTRKVELEYYDVELTDQWRENCEYYIYEESTADGYTVYISTSDTRNICVNENIHYYESSLGEELQDAIKNSGEIYVDDLYQDFIDDAIQELYLYLAERFHEQALDELQDEGYELVTT